MEKEINEEDQPQKPDNTEDFSGILNKLKNYLLEYYEPVQDARDADVHYTTDELWAQLYKIIPTQHLTTELVAQWMHLGGFTFADFGEMRFEWIMKKM
jgi:hypothetical protein